MLSVSEILTLFQFLQDSSMMDIQKVCFGYDILEQYHKYSD
jgi:hypothetical protein